MEIHTATSEASTSGPSVAGEPSILMENLSNFKKSEAPLRIVYRRKGSWVDFDPSTVECLRSGFLDRRMTMTVSVDGSPCLVDFLRMLMSDLPSGEERSIGWVDAAGRKFFPRRLVETAKPERKIVRDSLEEHSDESPEVSSVAVEAGSADQLYKNVLELFASEMKRSGRDVVVSSIRKCAHAGAVGAVRLRAFQARVECTKAVRGNANVRGGWYLGTLEELDAIVRFGFGKTNGERLGSDAHGAGVHLVPPQALHSSCLPLDADASGEKHLLFCRVIMGVPEKVERGSTQFHPSSDQFDSAVDDFRNPKWYIVWSTHMNTHIIPECIVSFRSAGPRPQVQQVMQTKKGCHAPRRTYPTVPLTFLQLYAQMGKLLPPPTMKTLDILFDRYKARKLEKEVFVRNLRSIVGADVISEAIKRMKESF